ncbi:MAG: phenylacetaldoxime dehydratase family protein, partial [Gammaproteobacteria bacterium]
MTKLMPANWKPPYPAFVTDVQRSHLNLTQFAIQAPSEAAGAAEAAELERLLAGAEGLLHQERVFHVDGEGFRNDIRLAYWSKPADYARWRFGKAPAGFFGRDRNGDNGVWIESLSSPRGYFETNYSRGNVDWGIARHHATHENPVHAYYGSMRDRIEAAEDGGLTSAVGRLNHELNAETRGRHLTARLPENLCFIRTVQGWLACSAEEREFFMQHSYPVYQRGVEFLRTHPVETNCISARLVTDAEQHPDRPQSETLAWFLSLTDLEAWTWSHPTHAAIFNTFMKHAEKFNFDVDILLGHEVLIVPREGGSAEYHNCHNA